MKDPSSNCKMEFAKIAGPPAASTNLYTGAGAKSVNVN